MSAIWVHLIQLFAVVSSRKSPRSNQSLAVRRTKWMVLVLPLQEARSPKDSLKLWRLPPSQRSTACWRGRESPRRPRLSWLLERNLPPASWSVWNEAVESASRNSSESRVRLFPKESLQMRTGSSSRQRSCSVDETLCHRLRIQYTGCPTALSLCRRSWC